MKLVKLEDVIQNESINHLSSDEKTCMQDLVEQTSDERGSDV